MNVIEEIGSRVSIYCGDWRDVFQLWPAEAVIITDPPYGIRHRRTDSHPWHNSNRISFRHRKRAHRHVIVGDRTTRERDDALTQVKWLAAAVFGPRRIDRVKPWGNPRDVLVLDKGQGVGAGDLTLPWKPCWETIAIYGRGWQGTRTSAVIRGNVIAFDAANAANGRRHPTEKSISALRELVRKSPKGLPIIDPFMGSGTTGVAAVLEGRDFYGAEVVAEYFATTRARLTGLEPDAPHPTLFG